MSGVHVRVRVAGEDYAIPVDEVREVGEPGQLTPVPGARAEVLGVSNLRGEVLPIIDLAALLGMRDAGGPERVVIVARDERSAGLAVGEVVDVGEVPEPSEEADSAYLSGAALFDGTLTGVVDVGAVLDALAGETVR
jgi:chemotaxis signal transduction protein